MPCVERSLIAFLTAVLYSGPMVAGIDRDAAELLPLHAATFVLWALVARPWPAEAAALHVAATVAAQVLLVMLLFGLGRGLGAFLPARELLPASAPLATALMATAAARLVPEPEPRAA